MDPSLELLLRRIDRLSDEFRELREGVHKAIAVADLDPEMALTRARKVLEYIVREVFERRVKKPAGTQPLENLLQRLVKDGHMPPRLEAYASTIRILGNVGTHRFGENVTTTDVHQSLAQLLPILEWYFEVERPDAGAPRPPPIPPVERADVPTLSEPQHGQPVPALPLTESDPPKLAPPLPPGPDSAMNALKAPAAALIVVNTLSLLTGLIILFNVVNLPDVRPDDTVAWMLFNLLLRLFTLLAAALGLTSGVLMLRHKWYVACLVGCILTALAPLPILTLPVGVWALWRLVQPKVRRTFT